MSAADPVRAATAADAERHARTEAVLHDVHKARLLLGDVVPVGRGRLDDGLRDHLLRLAAQVIKSIETLDAGSGR